MSPTLLQQGVDGLVQAGIEECLDRLQAFLREPIVVAAGRCTQRRSSRPPIDVAVRSSTSTSVLSARPERLASSSRLRRVAASSSSASSRSSQRMPRRCGKRGLLRVAHILQQASGRADRERSSAEAEACEVTSTELLAELALRTRCLEVPGWSLAQAGLRARRHAQGRVLGHQQLRRAQALEFCRQRLGAGRLERVEAAAREFEPGEAEAFGRAC